MKWHLHLFRCFFAFLLVSGSVAYAQDYPSKPIRLVLGYPPGTILDTTANPIISEIQKVLGQPLVLDFKPGANGSIAAKYVASSAPDGYTLLYGTVATIHPVLIKNNSADALKELTPVSLWLSSPYVLMSRGDLPVKSIAELAAYAKTRSTKLRYGYAASVQQLGMALLSLRTGIEFEGVPYRGAGQVLPALLSKEVDLTIGAVSSFVPEIHEGRIRALLIASQNRTDVLPEAQTTSEAGIKNYKLGVNLGVWAPIGTPVPIIRKLSAASGVALKVPSVVERLKTSFVAESIGSSPEQEAQEFSAEMQLWAEAAKAANYEPQ